MRKEDDRRRRQCSPGNRSSEPECRTDRGKLLFDVFLPRRCSHCRAGPAQYTYHRLTALSSASEARPRRCSASLSSDSAAWNSAPRLVDSLLADTATMGPHQSCWPNRDRQRPARIGTQREAHTVQAHARPRHAGHTHNNRAPKSESARATGGESVAVQVATAAATGAPQYFRSHPLSDTWGRHQMGPRSQSGPDQPPAVGRLRQVGQATRGSP